MSPFMFRLLQSDKIIAGCVYIKITKISILVKHKFRPFWTLKKAQIHYYDHPLKNLREEIELGSLSFNKMKS